MKSTRKELWFNIPARRAFVNITPPSSSTMTRAVSTMTMLALDEVQKVPGWSEVVIKYIQILTPETHNPKVPDQHLGVSSRW